MAWHHRLLNVLRQRQVADEIDEELQFHVDAAAQANIASGMPEEEARRDARRRFGNAAVTRERIRDADLLTILDDFRKDVAFALRSLRRRPAFAAVALLTLGLGIGATSAMFTVVRSVLLRPLPFPDPESLHVISYSSLQPGWLYPGMSDVGYLSFREATHTFSSMTTFAAAQATLTGAGDATRLSGAMVTTNFFDVLGVNAAAGRVFGPQDEGDGREKVVILADALWRGQFAADPRVLGQVITLDGLSFRVIGIMPAGFSYPDAARYWIPLTVTINPNLGYIRPVVGRVRAGVTRAQAQADLDAWVSALPPDERRPPDIVARVTPLHRMMVGDIRLPLLIVAGAVSFVLLIVCANVANLLLMRAVARRHEIATRLALGAGRGRLVRQLLTESILLSMAGGAAGTAIAFVAGPSIVATIPAGRLPRDLSIYPDAWVLAFTTGLSILTGLAVGLAPILQASRDSYFGILREGPPAHARGSRRVRDVLVVAQVALTLVLLVGAGLLVRSFVAMSHVPLGFTSDRVLTMTVDLPTARYRLASEAVAFNDRVLESLALLPNVESAGAVNWLPMGNMVIGGDVYAQDRPDLAGHYSATKLAVSHDYFRTVGIRLARGRSFEANDRTGSQPVVIVSESVAHRFWGDGDPIGKQLAVKDRPSAGDWLTVVGVVDDVRQRGFSARPAHSVYQPYPQVTSRFFVGYMTFVVRTAGDPVRAAPLMRAALKRIDPNEAPESLATLESIVGRTVAEPRFQARVLTLFSVVALLLAAIGIYGVLASSVLERRVEIGVRMALGADRTSVVRLVLRRTMALAAVGIVLGLGGAFAVSGVLKTLLYSVTPWDLPALLTAVGVIVLVAFGAAFVPARRASSIDPLIALKAE